MLSAWSCFAVEMANNGVKIFPSQVRFAMVDGVMCADYIFGKV